MRHDHRDHEVGDPDANQWPQAAVVHRGLTFVQYRPIRTQLTIARAIASRMASQSPNPTLPARRAGP